MHRANVWKQMEQNRVTRLMVSGDPFLLLRNDSAVLLRTDTYFNEGTVNIGLLHKFAVLSRC